MWPTRLGASLHLTGAALSLALVWAFPTFGFSRPVGYPAAYDRIIAAADKEARLTFYTTLHQNVAGDLITAFNKLYPHVIVKYTNGRSSALTDLFLHETSKHQPSADVIWTTAVDLQAKLINDGYAQAYSSPEKTRIPGWAVWNDQGYAPSVEPFVIAYNRREVPLSDVPKNHFELARLLKEKPKIYDGRIATYDPNSSEIGLLVLSHDVRATPETWDLVHQMAGAHVRLYANSYDMLDAIAKGEVLIGYNIVGSSAMEREAHDAAVGVILPSDYLLSALPVAIISKSAKHPNAAKLFLDFLLSQEGQTILSRHEMTPVRTDVRATTHQFAVDPGRVRTIRVGPGMLVDMDQQSRARLLRKWRPAAQPR